jgi:hypothetical protein
MADPFDNVDPFWHDEWAEPTDDDDPEQGGWWDEETDTYTREVY